MAIPSTQQEKRSFRRRFRAVLAGLEDTQRAAWSARIVAHLSAWLTGDAAPGAIALYAAHGPEADLCALHERLAPRTLAYPRVVPAGLEFHRVDDPGELRAGPFGIREPDPARHVRTDAQRIDVCLCPGLAFGIDGLRLGRGKGYYDVALRAMRADCARVGIGFAAQQCPTLPHEPHDVRMTHLASEEGIRAIAMPTPEAGA